MRDNDRLARLIDSGVGEILLRRYAIHSVARLVTGDARVHCATPLPGAVSHPGWWTRRQQVQASGQGE
ncbi:hypothetical protein AB0J28_11560 [Streptosporangium canum]|uniref:hypothetical protein n=1 Tax=Streptosporangium canum TaxID=324952 RepID=UPI00342E320B